MSLGMLIWLRPAAQGCLHALCTDVLVMPCSSYRKPSRFAAREPPSHGSPWAQVRAHIPPERVSPPLVGLLQSAGDSGRQAAARALKALSAGPSNSSKASDLGQSSSKKPCCCQAL